MKTLQEYPSLHALALSFRITLPRPREDWRLVPNPPTGEVIGIPGLRGRAIATNGILYALESGHASLHFVHCEWFVEDKEPTLSVAKPTKQKSYAKDVIREYV